MSKETTHKNQNAAPEGGAEAPAPAATDEAARQNAEETVAPEVGQDLDAPEHPDGEDKDGRASEVAELEVEAAKLKDQLLRALAETENTRRRAERERIDAQKYAPAGLARDLLAVADNLRRALDALPEELDDSLKPFAEGVAMVEKSLSEAFAKHAIEKVDPLGEKFDPHAHEAMFEAPVPGAEPGTVFQVLEAGYKLHDRLLRPARVGVARTAPDGGAEIKDTAKENEAD